MEAVQEIRGARDDRRGMGDKNGHGHGTRARL
jgi:hypothetical protein